MTNSTIPVEYDVTGYDTKEFPIKGGFVIFIDVLGIKGIWVRMNPKTVFKIWEEIIDEFKNSINDSELKQFFPYITVVSDTIIITCRCSRTYLELIFEVLIQPFIHALELKFFLRGTISYGVYHLSDLLTIGKAIDEAAHVHDQIEMIGIFTTPNFSKYLFSNGVRFETSSYIRYTEIPIKEIKCDDIVQKKYDGIALNWTRDNKHKILYDIINYEMKNQTKNKIKQKYENTLKFYDNTRTKYQ
jgi:hypothetical protein